MTDESPSIDEILAAFEFNDGVYQREMVDAAIERREAIIPRLIEILEQVRADPEPYIEDEDHMDHIYALMLLGHFRSVAAHGVIAELFSLSEDVVEDLYGDIVTGDLSALLANTCGGSLQRMQAMALNPEVGEYVRLSALEGMAYAAIDDPALRDEVVALLGTLFTGNEADKGSDFWGLAACTVSELYPEENMPVIEKAYEDGLISPGVIDFKSFERALKEGREATLDKLQAKREAYALDDLHASMEWWACFEEGDELFAPSSPTDLFFSDTYAPTLTTSKDQDKAKKKKKRKQAKASRRKNRR